MLNAVFSKLWIAYLVNFENNFRSKKEHFILEFPNFLTINFEFMTIVRFTEMTIVLLSFMKSQTFDWKLYGWVLAKIRSFRSLRVMFHWESSKFILGNINRNWLIELSAPFFRSLAESQLIVFVVRLSIKSFASSIFVSDLKVEVPRAQLTFCTGRVITNDFHHMDGLFGLMLVMDHTMDDAVVNVLLPIPQRLI